MSCRGNKREVGVEHHKIMGKLLIPFFIYWTQTLLSLIQISVSLRENIVRKTNLVSSF